MMRHISIYTLPITNFHISTTADIINEEILRDYSLSHTNIRSLVMRFDSSSRLSITNLFHKFPYLTHLSLETKLLLPPEITICSNRLRSLSLHDYSLFSCYQLLGYLPQVISLSITTSFDPTHVVDFCPKPIPSVTRLRILIDSIYINNLSNLIQYFPNVNEFYLTIKNTFTQSMDDFRQYEKLLYLSHRFVHLRYSEIILPMKSESPPISNGMSLSNSYQLVTIKEASGNCIASRTWY